jgi:hypothetical protein
MIVLPPKLLFLKGYVMMKGESNLKFYHKLISFNAPLYIPFLLVLLCTVPTVILWPFLALYGSFMFLSMITFKTAKPVTETTIIL